MLETSAERQELERLLQEHKEVVIQDESDERLLRRISSDGYTATAAQVRWAQSLFVKQKERGFKDFVNK